MSSFEDSHPNLLQGVSQQVARARLPGQLSSQENMLSDPVTGLRRRPGLKYMYNQTITGATPESIVVWYTDIAGYQCHVLVDTVTGTLTVRNSDYSILASLGPLDYLQAASAGKLRAASVGDSLFIANTEVLPSTAVTTIGAPPAQRGFFYVKASGFSKLYEIIIRNGSGTYTYSYTTPNGTDPSHPAQAATDYVATQLASAVNAATGTTGVAATRLGSYVYLSMATANGTLSASTGSGDFYVFGSGDSHLTSSADLPSVLPDAANGYVIATGPEKAAVYYRYVSATQSWLEAGAWESPSSLNDMPVELYYDGTNWILDESGYEGRLSGDDDTNENPQFLEWGISGISSYQGRLVILAGPWVSLSASTKPRRFYRGTVTELVDDDPIHIGSSATSSAAYEYALPFSKDLLLFSAKYQALIPASNTAITPRNAQVVVTSTYASDMTAGPVPLGRTVMYTAPRSSDFFGIMEMLPSSAVDSQYVSTDSTEHLPKYMAGSCRFSVSSSVSNIVLFAPSGDKKSLIVHEYSWSGDEKVLRAWHRWSFEYDVAYAYFSGSVINIMFMQNGVLVNTVVDPRVGVLTANTEHKPYLDLYTELAIVAGVATLPVWLTTFLGVDVGILRASIADGGLGGQEIGITIAGGAISTVPSFPTGNVFIGLAYYSGFSPTPPVVKDRKEIPISTNKVTLLRYTMSTKDTAEFKVSVRDVGNTGAALEFPINPTVWTSPELQLDDYPNTREGSVIIPCRTNADTTSVVIFTEDLGELNPIALEYVCRYHQKIRRR